MNRTSIVLLAGIAAAWFLYRGIKPDDRAPDEKPVEVSLPSSEFQRAVEPVAVLLKDGDAPRVKALYAALADVIRRDSTVLSSTSQVREAHSRMGKLLFAGRPAKDASALVDAANKALADMLSLDPKPLDAAMRQRCVDAFLALAWAAQEAE